MNIRNALSFILLAVVFCFSLVGCSHLFYQPDQILYYPPEKLGLHPETLHFPSRDGTPLLAWYFPAKTQPAKGTILQFHGNAENMSSHYMSLVWLTQEGYNLVTFDYRGYGGSEGIPNQKGVYLDGLAALDQAWKMHSASQSKQFIVYGQSLGGAIASRSLIDWEKRDQVNLLVMDSSFYSYPTVARRILSRHWVTWVISPLGWLLVSNEYSAEKAIKQGKTRLLVIHDEKDPVVPFSCGEDVFNTATAPKEFWKLEQGRHVGSFIVTELKDPAVQMRQKFVKYLEESQKPFKAEASSNH